MPNFFSYYFLLWSIPILQLYNFILVKTNTMPKKSWGRKNSITILYIMLIRYGIIGRQTTIYILLYSSLLSSSLILYYTHETRTRIYYYYIALFFFAFFFSYYYIILFIMLYSYTLAALTELEQYI